MKYLIVDDSCSYPYVYEYDTIEEVEEYIEDCSVHEVKVYEVVRQLKLETIPAKTVIVEE